MIERRVPLKRTAFPAQREPLRRTPMKPGRSAGKKRQDVLRVNAYQLVDARSGGRCELRDFGGVLSGLGRCPRPAAQHHHRRPRKAGGSTDPTTETPANLLHVCAGHHAEIERNREQSYLLGLLVRAEHDPERVPASIFPGCVWLTVEGTYSHTPPVAA